MNAARVALTDPDNVEITFSLSLRAKQWRELLRQMPNDGSPSGQLGIMISSMLGECIERADKTYSTSGYTICEVAKRNPPKKDPA